MAIGVIRVHGDAHGVAVVDVDQKVSGDITSAVLHSTLFRKPSFMAVIVKDVHNNAVDITNELDTNEAVEAILKVVANTSSILAYQVENASSGQISLMFEGSAITASELQTAIRAMGTTVGANNKDVSGSTVTDLGFKLAVA
jgi:hypothetical protein